MLFFVMQMLALEGVLLALRDYKFQSFTYMSLGALFITYQVRQSLVSISASY